MDDLEFYIKLGKNHILDVNGYDHILFIISLCIIYTFKDWKRVAWLVTAFTIGHSLTLALAILRIIQINSVFIEFLIPITILITSLINLFTFSEDQTNTNTFQRYLIASLFGLIHGLGFSNFLLSILGRESNITLPLLYFNIGLELGQLAIVLVSLLVSFVFIHWLKVKHSILVQILSVVITVVSLKLIWSHWIF